MSIIAIACVDADWGIGYNGELLERIPADMKFFKECVEHSISICGRKTFDTLPKKAFSQRTVVVISSKYDSPICIANTGTSYMNLERCIKGLKRGTIGHTYDGKNIDVYIIGGASIYKQLLPYCDKAYITKIYKSHENVDSYFPNLDQMENEWELIEESPPASYKDFYYSFTTYQRIN